MGVGCGHTVINDKSLPLVHAVNGFRKLVRFASRRENLDSDFLLQRDSAVFEQRHGGPGSAMVDDVKAIELA